MEFRICRNANKCGLKSKVSYFVRCVSAVKIWNHDPNNNDCNDFITCETAEKPIGFSLIFFLLVDQLNYANEARVKWCFSLFLSVSIFCQLQLHHRLFQIHFLFGLKCQHKIFFKATHILWTSEKNLSKTTWNWVFFSLFVFVFPIRCLDISIDILSNLALSRAF